MSLHDVVIRGGTVVDGTGAPRRTADVALSDGVITEVGRVSGSGHREIDADGALVIPGFVDMHTHYDGQATWDTRLQPSAWHGVTTVVSGNCGVGFAPVVPAYQQKLIDLMEGIEDIPGTALHEGLPWTWETFEEYLDFLGGRRFDLDLGTQVPHAALRVRVMGDRAIAGTTATDAEKREMARLAAAAVRAGALGFSTSRTLNHKTVAGALTPSYDAGSDELVAIAEAVGATGRGVLQVVTDFLDIDADMTILRSMVRVSGRPLTVSLAQNHYDPAGYRTVLRRIGEADAEGLPIRAQVAVRGIGLVMGLDLTLHPFMTNPAWQRIAGFPPAERTARLARPETKAAVLAAQTREKAETRIGGRLIDKFHLMYELTDPPQYEPDPQDSVAARAEREGREPVELAYDLLAAGAMLYVMVLNWENRSLEPVREMLASPWTLPGLSDGGAHVGSICDGSFPTTLLQHWGRDRPAGRLELEYLVRRQCRDTATAIGLDDRGLLAPGYRADLNVIDLDSLRLHRPEVHRDLPAGGSRLLQRADGYRHTFVRGVETYADGQETGELPGRLIRGPQPAPAG
ncbi:N-acyl-D-amino-acid deacylase family protein [Cryptosporangium aurantiacum]|uniref:Dihydroorotase n=1 Tax=Cryptosporangium aurantiacum TaxID=134849 RepID=A0A1M7R4H5_9ACTN|nr:amidohydrolase family protein [Cryptosporangium aurantiacum]SHN39989.1 dihydroorotase [Cryptosporangium aurantiacum]